MYLYNSIDWSSAKVVEIFSKSLWVRIFLLLKIMITFRSILYHNIFSNVYAKTICYAWNHPYILFYCIEINIFVWINGIYVRQTAIKPMRIWNLLYQSFEAKQRICESENHFMKNHSLHQKDWPSEVTASD